MTSALPAQTETLPIDLVVQPPPSETAILEMKVATLTKRLEKVEKENKHHASPWKTLSLTCITYAASLATFSLIIQSDAPYLDSIVPTAAYLISRLPVLELCK